MPTSRIRYPQASPWLQIPPPGFGLTAEAMYPDGGEMFAVQVDSDGLVSYPETDAKSLTDQEHDGDGARPAPWMSTEGTRDALKQAVGWITGSYNSCKMSDQVSASASYQGISSLESDITTSDGFSSCGDGSIDGRDGESVVDFGNLDVEDHDWTNDPQPGCQDRMDLRSMAVHEFGHSFGLGHVAQDSHEWLTMSPSLEPCQIYERSPGKGDVLGLRNTY